MSYGHNNRTGLPDVGDVGGGGGGGGIPVDLSFATTDYLLGIGQTAYIYYTNATSVPLHIEMGNEALYEIDINGNGNGVNSDNLLLPNNTTYSGIYSSINGQISTTDTSFKLGRQAILKAKLTISNNTNYKHLTTESSVWTNIAAFTTNTTRNLWYNSSIMWTSIGTLVFASSSSGKIVIRRII